MLEKERRKIQRRCNRDAAVVSDGNPRRINIERRILNLDVHSIAEWLEEPRKTSAADGQESKK